MRIIFLFFTLFVFSLPAFATFGLGPCCSGATCGIVPCDASCAGSAISTMGTSVGNALNAVNQYSQDLTDAVNDVIDSMNDLSTDVSDTITDANDEFIQGLSASTNKIELANSQKAVAVERASNHFVTSLVAAFKNVYTANITDVNNSTYLDMSQPISGEDGSNHAPGVVQLYSRNDQLLIATNEGFYDYLLDANETTSGANRGIHVAQSISDLINFGSINKILTSNTLENTDLDEVQTILGLIASKYPLEDRSNNPDSIDFEIKRRSYNALAAIAFDGLATVAISKTGLEEADWATHYQYLDTNSDNLLSLTGYYEAEVKGRLSDQEWWGAVKKLNQAGLQREIAYGEAMELQLKNRMLNIANKSKMLSAILVAQSTSEANISASGVTGNQQ